MEKLLQLGLRLVQVFGGTKVIYSLVKKSHLLVGLLRIS